MARKRSLKKQHKQTADRLRQLDKLLKGQKDEAFLELAAQVADLAAAGLTAAYGQVFERRLLNLLQAGDLESVADLLRQMRPEAASRPMARLAEAVLMIAEGQLDQARNLLKSLAEASAEPSEKPIATSLLRHLSALCGDPSAPPPAGLSPEVGEFLKLRRAILRHASGELKRLPSNLRLESAAARLLLEYCRALDKIRSGKQPSLKVLSQIYETARALEGAPSTGKASAALLSNAIAMTELLRDGSTHLTSLLARGVDRGDLEELINELRNDRARLTELLGPHQPRALASLQYALHQLMRSLLTQTVTLYGSTALARVRAAVGSGLDPVLEIDLAEGASEESLELWTTFQNLLDQEDFFNLARALHEEATRTESASQLVRLWGVELWALDKATEIEEQLFEIPLIEEAPQQSRASRRKQLRVRTMSRELASRLPRDDQRRSVAETLRRQFLEDSDEMVHEAALPALGNLLRYLPDDRALLVLALGAAMAADQRDLVRRYSQRIADLSPAAEAEIPTLSRLVLEPPPLDGSKAIVEFYRFVEPLFGDVWPSTRADAAMFIEFRTMTNLTVFIAECGPPGAWYEPMREEFQGFLQRDFDYYRPLFGQDISFQVSEWVMVGILQQRSGLETRLGELLAEHSTLEAALSCLRMIDSLWEAPGLGQQLGKSRQLALDFVMARLDDRWWLWHRAVTSVLGSLDKSQLEGLRDRLENMQEAPEHDTIVRQEMEWFLTEVKRKLAELRRSRGPRGSQRDTSKRTSRKKKTTKGHNQRSPPTAPRATSKAETGEGTKKSIQLGLFDVFPDPAKTRTKDHE